MAVAYDPATSHAAEWRFWPGRANATLRKQTAIGVYTPHALSATGGAVKFRALTFREMAASAGAYTAQDRAILVPSENLPTGVKPAPGDQFLDAASVTWTVGEVSPFGKFGLTHRCVVRALAIVGALATSGQLMRASNAQDIYGRAALSDYAAVGSPVLCRVQPEDGDVGEVFGRTAIARKYTAYLETPVTVAAHDQWLVDTTAYTVLGFRNPERVWDLMSLSLELIP